MKVLTGITGKNPMNLKKMRDSMLKKAGWLLSSIYLILPAILFGMAPAPVEPPGFAGKWKSLDRRGVVFTIEQGSNGLTALFVADSVYPVAQSNGRAWLDLHGFRWHLALNAGGDSLRVSYEGLTSENMELLKGETNPGENYTRVPVYHFTPRDLQYYERTWAAVSNPIVFTVSNSGNTPALYFINKSFTPHSYSVEIDDIRPIPLEPGPNCALYRYQGTLTRLVPSRDGLEYQTMRDPETLEPGDENFTNTVRFRRVDYRPQFSDYLGSWEKGDQTILVRRALSNDQYFFVSNTEPVVLEWIIQKNGGESGKDRTVSTNRMPGWYDRGFIFFFYPEMVLPRLMIDRPGGPLIIDFYGDSGAGSRIILDRRR